MKQIEINDVAYQVVETVSKSFGKPIPEAFDRICLVYIEALYKKYAEMESRHEQS